MCIRDRRRSVRVTGTAKSPRAAEHSHRRLHLHSRDWWRSLCSASPPETLREICHEGPSPRREVMTMEQLYSVAGRHSGSETSLGIPRRDARSSLCPCRDPRTCRSTWAACQDFSATAKARWDLLSQRKHGELDIGYPQFGHEFELEDLGSIPGSCYNSIG